MRASRAGGGTGGLEAGAARVASVRGAELTNAIRRRAELAVDLGSHGAPLS